MLEPLDFDAHLRAFVSRAQMVKIARDHFEWSPDDGDPFPFLSDWAKEFDGRNERIAAIVKIITHLPEATMKPWCAALLGAPEESRSSNVISIALAYVLDAFAFEAEDEDVDVDPDEDEVDEWWRRVATSGKSAPALGLKGLQEDRRRAVEAALEKLEGEKRSGKLRMP